MIAVLRKELNKPSKKILFFIGAMLFCSCVPSTIPVSYDDLAKYKGESEGVTIYVELRAKGNLILPGDRYIVYVYNQTENSIVFDYDNDEYHYYTINQVFKAHLFKVGGVYPRWVVPGQVASIGILTDRKGLSISGFEVYLSKSDLKIFAGSIEKNN